MPSCRCSLGHWRVCKRRSSTAREKNWRTSHRRVYLASSLSFRFLVIPEFGFEGACKYGHVSGKCKNELMSDSLGLNSHPGHSGSETPRLCWPRGVDSTGKSEGVRKRLEGLFVSKRHAGGWPQDAGQRRGIREGRRETGTWAAARSRQPQGDGGSEIRSCLSVLDEFSRAAELVPRWERRLRKLPP